MIKNFVTSGLKLFSIVFAIYFVGVVIILSMKWLEIILYLLLT